MRSSYGSRIVPPNGRTASTSRASTSTSVTSATTQSTLSYRLNSCRSGTAIWPSDRTPVAHW